MEIIKRVVNFLGMKEKIDPIRRHFETCDVVIVGNFTKPITGRQYNAISKAAKLICDAGLKPGITEFYVIVDEYSKEAPE